MQIDMGQYEVAQKVANSLANSLANHAAIIVKSNCDKHGLGFNLDARFSSAKTTISLDSWRGAYGNSGCSTAIEVGDKDKFASYLVSYLNANCRAILNEIAKMAKTEAALHAQTALASLEKAKAAVTRAMDLESEHGGENT